MMKSLVQNHHLRCNLKLSEIYSNLFSKQLVFYIHHFLEYMYLDCSSQNYFLQFYMHFKIDHTETQRNLFTKGINE